MKPFVERLQVETFACIKSVDITLTRLHAFIGPNDSGKSTLLRAVAYLAMPGAHSTPTYDLTQWGQGARVIAERAKEGFFAEAGTLHNRLHAGRAWKQVPSSSFGAVQLVHLEPDALRAPCRLIPHGANIGFSDIRGSGLAAVLDAMLSRHPEQFLSLRARFVELFTGVERLEIQNRGHDQKVIGAVLSGGVPIGPAQMSEGMLYWLAFKALQYATKPSILLVEEPENGLHPARVREIMALLREISAETQVLIATHSPLVINELQPNEVTIITRTAKDGTIATPMMETKNFAQRSSIYALGELWLSYADGELERELMPDAPKDTKAAG